ncbi:nucleoside hydrolase [Candidatus Woesearchaeota archaeon]|nr:nucleoside hydrolase [Candidatus Woesearchaeota archaeon]
MSIDEAIIIDTDIGTDVDDAIALMYAVKLGMNIKLVTTVHGDAYVRARIAKKLVMLLGADIPVAAGESKPLKQKHLYWEGDEGADFVDAAESLDIRLDGVEAIAEAIYASRNNVGIASIGPMTNIARAFQKYPDLPALVSHIYAMGNAIITPGAFYINYRAHNFKVDPEAVDIVFASPAPITIVTTEVCKKSSLTREDFGLIKSGGVPASASAYIHAAAQSWMGKAEQDCAYLYDPLVVHHFADSAITEKAVYGNVSIITDVNPGFKEILLRTITDSRLS